MAGAALTITVDDAEARGLLDRLAAFGGEPRRLMLRDIGETLFHSTLDRARSEVGPDGVRWRPLSEDYEAFKKAKRPGAPMLRFDNLMLGASAFNYQVGDGFVDIGTNAPYGAIQQFGGTPGMAPGPAAVPARPFLGLSSADSQAIEQIAGEHLDRFLDG